MKLFRKIFKFFDRTEDKTRSKLSKYPVLYAIIGAVGLVLLWRGFGWWRIRFLFLTTILLIRAYFIDGAISIGASVRDTLLVSGLFVSFFIGDRIILVGPEERKENGRKKQRKS